MGRVPTVKIKLPHDSGDSAIINQADFDPDTHEPYDEAEAAKVGYEPVDATGTAEELAEEHGIDLSEVEGTGKDGRILKGDVEALVAERSAEDNG